MDLLFYDFETYFDREYSLRRMSPAEYILDPRFEALGCGFKRPGQPAYWVDKPDLERHFRTIDWANTCAVSHNALFDACILKWQYGIDPKMLGDTMAMARNWWSHETGSIALATLAPYAKLPPKMSTLGKTLGRSYDAIAADPALHAELRVYGGDDSALCEGLFNAMMQEGFPQSQLLVIDRQIKMATQPKFVVDQNLLAEYLGKILEAKAKLLSELGMTLDDKSALMSNDQLALLLMAHGVSSPPRKVSKATGLENWAFAKTDEEFTDLQDHPEPMVQAIVAARLGIKTTIEETRTQRFINIGNLNWAPHERPNSLPIPLKFSGARTHRFSGDWLMNAQNLGNDSEIRYALKAPRGMRVVSVDARQIEARLNAAVSLMLAKENGHKHSDLISQFAMNRDVYSQFASVIYNQTITQETHPNERFVGKTGILSLGYGSSWLVFQNMIRVKGKGLVISDGTAIATVETYRDTYPEIPHGWRRADGLLNFIAAAGPDQWMQFGPVWAGREVIVLPNGNRLNYRNLHQEWGDWPDGGGKRAEWWYEHGKRKLKIYGAKLIENIIQALAFVHIMEADARVAAATGGLIGLAHQVHDELIYVVAERHAEMVLELGKREVSRKPAWLPWVPFDAAGGIGTSYGNAKH